MAARRSGVMPGAGASSTTFWWRRWIEQSRSNRWTNLPWRSAKTWISMWRGAGEIAFDQHTGRRRRRRGLRLGRGTSASANWLGALDHPHSLAAAAGAGLDEHGIADAGRLRRASRAGVLIRRRDSRARAARRPVPASSALAADLLPMARMAAGGGPMNTIPAAAAGLGEVGVLRQGSRSRGGSASAPLCLGLRPCTRSLFR